MGRVPLLIPLAVLVAIILLGDSLGLRHPQEPPSFGNSTCSGYLLSVNEAHSTGYLAIAEIDSVDNCRIKPFKARVHLLANNLIPIAGERLKFTTRLSPLAARLQIPDAVDLMADIRRQGVTASAVVPYDSIVYLKPTRSLRYYCADANAWALNRLKRTGLDDTTIDVLAAMLLGRSRLITTDTRAVYSAAGLSHLLALSGMHVAVIAMIISFALWPFYFGRHVKTRLLLTIIALLAYAAFTGFIPSVTRAVIMASVYMTGRIIQRKSPPLNSLCLAAIILLLITPSDLYSAGFQMSFAAVLGIIVFFPLINRVSRRRHPRIYAIWSYPALSVSAMILTGIVSAYHFHVFPVYFLPANLMVIPLVPLALASGIVSLLFEIPFLSEFFVGAIDYISGLWANMPGATVADLYPSALGSAILVAAVTLVGLALNSGKRFWIYESLTVLAGIILIMCVRPRTVYPDKETYYVSLPRYSLTITASQRECVIYTNARAGADLEEIFNLYSIILRDFMAKRNISKLIVKNEYKQQFPL